MFRHYCVILRDFVINTVPSYTNLNEDITKCLNAYCNTKQYVSTTVFITQGNM